MRLIVSKDQFGIRQSARGQAQSKTSRGFPSYCTSDRFWTAPVLWRFGRRLTASVASACLVSSNLTAAEHPVSSASEISKVAPELKPGDALVLKDGIWKDQIITLEARGTARNPVALRAQTA